MAVLKYTSFKCVSQWIQRHISMPYSYLQVLIATSVPLVFWSGNEFSTQKGTIGSLKITMCLPNGPNVQWKVYCPNNLVLCFPPSFVVCSILIRLVLICASKNCFAGAPVVFYWMKMMHQNHQLGLAHDQLLLRLIWG